MEAENIPKSIPSHSENNNTILDFVLIRQKDYILKLVNTRRKAEARATLKCVKELWDLHEYTYKYTELMQKIDSLDL
jgi:hypothetical protein